MLAEERLRDVREECRDLLALSTPATAQLLLNDIRGLQYEGEARCDF